MKKSLSDAEAFFILFLSHYKFSRLARNGDEIHALRQ